jgi:hypothetical protein
MTIDSDAHINEPMEAFWRESLWSDSSMQSRGSSRRTAKSSKALVWAACSLERPIQKRESQTWIRLYPNPTRLRSA